MSFEFIILAGLLLVSALLVVTLKNIFHCALALIVSLLALAGLYYLLGAPFLSVVQLVIYVGAIVVLIIFAIMLTSRISDEAVKATNHQVIPAFLATLALFYLAYQALKSAVWPIAKTVNFDPIFDLGREMLTTYLLPFEVISLLLLVVLVGAIVIARRD